MNPVFASIFSALPRQGPGRPSDTLRALGIARPCLPSQPRVLDLGCGSGGSTVVLAESLSGPPIVALDCNADPLAALQAAHPERIRGLVGDMAAIDPGLGPFELVWSEGAAYSIGFARALTAWRTLLAPGGVLALSELCWLTDDRPAPAVQAWSGGYPDMCSEGDRLADIEAAGYDLRGSFALPPESWWELFYTPMEARLAELRQVHAADSEALSVIEIEQAEIELYRKHGTSYGYVFFVMQLRP